MDEMKDSQFMTADEKRKVLKQWVIFLKYGCKWEHFTKSLYHHLIQHCSFIAHYDRAGFYGTYFERGEDRAHFLSQFDGRNGEPPPSVEYGMTYWARGDYEDINGEMIRIAGRYIPTLITESGLKQKEADVEEAKRLLAKHGIKVFVASQGFGLTV